MKVRSERFRHPGLVIGGSFAAAIAVGTVLLWLPVAAANGQRTGFMDAVFTSTSAVCVTGLVTVDTATHWSVFGQVVILGLIQVGGLGIMTVASLTVVLLSRRLGLRARMIAAAQTRTVSIRDIGRLIRNVTVFAVVSEIVVAAILTVRLATTTGMSVGHAAYEGTFHAISAFNNAGFALYADSLTRYAGDAWILLTISAAVIVGGLGFPVIFELARAWRRPGTWSVTTRVTVWVTVVLLVVGTTVIALVERENPGTLATLPHRTRLLAAFFTATMPRTAGFNAIDIGAMTPEGLFMTDFLMFIGGGSAGTAGGIKVTTFGLLAVVVWSEMRGVDQANVGYRQIPSDNQRQALAVALISGAIVVISTFVLLADTAHAFEEVLFEVVSAFATVGLSTGITAGLPDTGKMLLIALMFVGRIGPLTLASALALRDRGRGYELPTERITVG
ncbi:TrkH family potassium uptake protein [Mycobacterium sp. PSTR-4-N]|uniref:TrkH family potassium uptake protein n=1 Tax=Mycobacterium sp. PSTR-4-N TaxID=2917745 RepID=UPI001F14D9BF|nr:potassium transporter TrkG [Mycobacterium sp. PSTR-4-N]MCG7592723.1 TrkH family potassium uptake protein [Mycobacterium sp. PSTR-4-N]